MRVLATCIVALGLAVSPALAGTAAPGSNDSAASNTSPTAAAQPAAAPSAAANADPAAKPEPSSSEVAAELQQLRDLLEAQAKQLQEQQQKMQLLEDQLNASNAARENIVAAPTADPSAIGPVAGVAASANLANGNPSQEKTGPPTSIQFKGITLTPGGFMAAETVWRQKALASDVNTAFGSTPFNGSPNASMGEFQASGRQSRISMLAEGKLDNVKIGGYYEMDFLSAGTTSTNTQSNSYTMRQRQFWAQAAFNNGLTFTGGQQWSLITETTHGMDNRTEALPLTIDAQYNVGFSWARQFGFRVTKNFGNKVWLGFSVEEAAANVKVHGNPTIACTPANPTADPATAATCPSGFNGTLVTVPTGVGTTGTAVVNNTTYNNFLLGAFGTSSGLYNPLGNYAYNEAPDFVVKAVFEPGWGHYEIFGLVSEFRDRTYPCVPVNGGVVLPAGCPAGLTTIIGSGAGATNDSRTGGGVGANARWNLLAKKVDIGVHFLGGDGIARYGSSGALSDLTVRPNGDLAPIHNFQGLGTLQFHPTPKWDIYLNVGAEYEARTDFAKAGPGGTINEGYGYPGLANFGCWSETLPVSAPATNTNLATPTGVAGSTGFIPGPLNSCTGDPRNLVEGTLGFWYRFYNGPKGRIQLGMQYSNFILNTWRGVGTGTINGVAVTTNGAPHSDNNMVFTSFRYYLP